MQVFIRINRLRNRISRHDVFNTFLMNFRDVLYLNSLTYAVLEFIADASNGFTLKFSRKLNAFAFTVPLEIGLIFLVITDYSYLLPISRFFVSLMFMMIYTWSNEILPTNLRSTGLGITNVFCRFSAIFVTNLVDLRKISAVYFNAPLLALNTLCLVACYFLPETHNKKLPETIDDLKNLK